MQQLRAATPTLTPPALRQARDRISTTGYPTLPFSLVAPIAGIVFLGSALSLLFASTAMPTQLGPDSPPAAVVMAHRMGATFADLSSVLVLSLVLPPVPAKSAGFAPCGPMVIHRAPDCTESLTHPLPVWRSSP